MIEVSPAIRTKLAKALWVAQQDYPEWAARTVDDVFSPADDWPDEALKVEEQVDALISTMSLLLFETWRDGYESRVEDEVAGIPHADRTRNPYSAVLEAEDN